MTGLEIDPHVRAGLEREQQAFEDGYEVGSRIGWTWGSILGAICASVIWLALA